MTSNEKKCDCYTCRLARGEGIANSEKPVQEKNRLTNMSLEDANKLVSPGKVQFVSHPDTEGWEKEFVETFYCYNLKTQSPAGAEKETVAFISKLLQDERERLGVFTKPHQKPEDFVEDGIQFERQRIEDAVGKLKKHKHDGIPSARTFDYDADKDVTIQGSVEDCDANEAECYNAALRDVLKIIRGEGTERA